MAIIAAYTTISTTREESLPQLAIATGLLLTESSGSQDSALVEKGNQVAETASARWKSDRRWTV